MILDELSSYRWSPVLKTWILQDIARAIEMYQQAETLALVFMVDSTSSMGPHIAAVKTQITSIVQNMLLTNPQMRLHVGFIGYRDHSDERRFETLPLTSDIRQFQVDAYRFSVRCPTLPCSVVALGLTV